MTHGLLFCALKEWIYELPSYQEKINQSTSELIKFSNNSHNIDTDLV